MTDTRDVPLTLTFTRQEWDAIRSRGWSYVPGEVADSAERRFTEVTKEGLDERKSAAHEERLAELPKLTPRVKVKIAAEIKRLITEFLAGKLRVDHLGRPATVIDGFAVSLIPRISGGGSSIHFAYARPLWFDHHVIPLSSADKRWVINTIGYVAGVEDPRWWNDAPVEWVSVQWR
jgi:hypothetical protein